jgi:nucleotide-binding universal stress UspA family protein
MEDDMPLIEQPVSISLKRIMFATDFSAASEKAASYARVLAHRFGSEVEIAHVFDRSTVVTYEEAILGLPVWEREKVYHENLETLCESFADNATPAHAQLVESHDPGAALVHLAKEMEASLIVAGTQSKRGVERLLLGSTAEKLIRSAECPVLTVGPHARPAEDCPLAFRSIVFATDFSEEAAKAAAFALSFAEDSGAHLSLCYVYRPELKTPGDLEYLDREFRDALRRLIPDHAYDWCTPECVVEHGDAAKSILGVADRVNADLIVLGARKATFWLSHFERGLTPALLSEARCPVLTIC